MFICSLIKTFTGNWVILIWNQNLNFIIKIIPRQRVFRTIKKKVNFDFYLIGYTKKTDAYPAPNFDHNARA